ncbi:MAG: LamG domain-containing protein [Methanoregula sp.]|nr:LamG domain-containing protein [Methanoregula sp.]
MSCIPDTGTLRKYTLIFLVLFYLISGACALTVNSYSAPEPSVYFNFNEGSGNYAFDVSGNGNTGAIYGASRIENGACGRATSFNGINNYVEIPFSSRNHPQKEITVSLWFYTDSFEPQVLISTYEDGGYRLGFDDGNDLWWTINLEGTGEVSIPVQHESISQRQWHQVTGTYDGQTSKVYLDGVLRNMRNATGAIHYEFNNYITLGADAGSYNLTDQNCPQYFRGGLDEVRIYPVALNYGQIMDDRFRCSQEPVAPSENILVPTPLLSSCAVSSGSVTIGVNDAASRILSFTNQTEIGIWHVSLPRGSTLVVRGKDFYSKAYPDAWYIEIADEKGRITRSIAFPNTNNAPVKGVIPSGNATVYVKYFDGMERFPAKVAIQFESITPPPPPITPPTILNYPIIVIYSASWATLVSIILVMVWLHRRKNEGGKKDNENGKDEEKITE